MLESTYGMSSTQVAEYWKKERARIASEMAAAEEKQRAAKELSDKRRREESLQNTEAGRLELARIAVAAAEAKRQEERREQETKRAFEIRRQDQRAQAEARVVEKAQQDAAQRLSVPLDVATADRLDKEALTVFPIASPDSPHSGHYLLIRDGTLLRMSDEPHTRQWKEFVSMPLFLARSGGIRLHVAKVCISAEMFGATTTQKQTLLDLIEESNSRYCLQRHFWLKGATYFQTGPTIDREYFSKLQAATDLNDFLK